MDPLFIAFEIVLGAALVVGARLAFGRPIAIGLLVFLAAVNGLAAAFVPMLPAGWRVLAAIGAALPLAFVSTRLIARRRA